MNIDPYSIINKYYRDHKQAREILIEHSEAVAAKSVLIGKQLGLAATELDFIREASLLHDIGMFLTSAPSIACFGDSPYICHGFLGHDLLVKEGFPQHALVCERHTGTGLTIEDIQRQNLPLPLRQMTPVSLPEQIITYADKFFSKNPRQLGIEQDLIRVRKKLRKHGSDKLRTFDQWHKQFSK